MYVLKQTADTNTVLLHNLIQAIREKIEGAIKELWVSKKLYLQP
jgi:hypothetical protein